MGSVNRVSCESGYTSTVMVGGNRETFHEKSVFPFYCKNCGIVSVNVHGGKTKRIKMLNTQILEHFLLPKKQSVLRKKVVKKKKKC